MTEFSQKPIVQPKRVGVRLRELREFKRLTLGSVAGRTKISAYYLGMLESGQFADIPFAFVYKKNFIRSYAIAVGADPTEFLNQFLLEELAPEPHTPAALPKPSSRKVTNLPAIIRLGLLIAMVGSVILYVGLQVKRIIEPPQLTIFSPQDGLVTTNHTLLVQGQAERETRIAINGQPIKNSDDGRFQEVLDLSVGVNVIKISAEKKHGKITTATRYVIVKGAPIFSFNKQ